MRHNFDRIAILGGGAAAIQLIHAVRELARDGAPALRTIALHADAERRAYHVREADEAEVVPATWRRDPGVLVDALRRANAEAVWSAASGLAGQAAHAGQAGRAGQAGQADQAGQAGLAALCEQLGLVFVGPSSALSRRLADPAELRRLVERAGWPAELRDRPRRRVAIAVFADRRGTVWVPAITDVTLRRAGEPVMLECPVLGLPADTERVMRDAAAELAHELGVVGMASVEAVVAPATGRFAFVALGFGRSGHHAAEATLGLDLIKLELAVVRGAVLAGEPPRPRGHAIAIRLTTEDPGHQLAPATGVVELYRPPAGLGLRIAPDVAEGEEVGHAGEGALATLVAWGSARREALGRLAAGLRDTSLVIRGGATNKACLLALCARPEVASLEVDDDWLDDQLAGGGWRDDTHADIALVAVAIHAYEALRAGELERFLRTANRGRPRVGATGGYTIALRHGGASYALGVAQLAEDRYRVESGPSRCDVHVEPLGPHERRLGVAGHSYRVRAAAAGLRHVVEVDGVPCEIVVEDTLGVVRAPSPAVVLRILVSPGTAVVAGQPVIVLESMKMEITVTAPGPGRIQEILVTASSQVDLDAPLVIYQKLCAEAELARAGELVLPRDAGEATVDPRQRFARASAELRRLLLGYDADARTARGIAADWKAAAAAMPDGDAELLRAETDALAMFTDVQSLQRRQPAELDAELGDDSFASAREHLCTFLRSLATRGDGLPAAFLAVLERSVARYGVSGLDDGPRLRDALHRIFCAHERADEQALAIAAILDRRLAAGPASGIAAGDEFHVVLNQLISATRRRLPGVHALALEVRHAMFDEPMFQRTRRAIYRRALAYVGELEASSLPEARAACVAGLVDCPLPLIAVLAPRLATASPGARAAMLEVLTRRTYRARGLGELVVHESEGVHHLITSYHSAGRRITLITTYAALEALSAAVRRLGPVLAAAGDPAGVVVDFYTWGPVPLTAPDAAESAVRAALTSGGLPAGLCRVVVATAAPEASPGLIHCVTYRRGEHGLVEDVLYRGMHPAVGLRLHLWRLAGFTLERLASVESVYLYRGIARANPRDERLFAMAEVHDLTPVRDAGGRIVQLPYLERVLGEALAAIRKAQATRPVRDRLQWNRVVLQLEEPLTLTADELADVVRHLAPATEGLGIEQVMVHTQVPDPATGALRDTVLRISNTLDGGLHVRFSDPPAGPLATLTEYEQKVIALRRRGLTYPYEIIRLLTPPGADGADRFPRGDFVEHDLDATGALQPVARPPGENTANVVVGVLRSFTAEVPEGVTRVVVLGDAHKEMGSLAEPECRRIIAALDLAERLRVPLEWFALSAGAKISRTSGTENMDWISAVLRRIVELTQRGGEINVVVCGINVGAQPYWNAEATMLMHTRGILVMIGDSAMVLTGKQALDYSGGMSADDNQDIGGYERIMGPNGQAQYWAPDVGQACRVLLRHYAHTYVVPGERFPRRIATTDPRERDVRSSPHPDRELVTVGDVFGPANADRKRAFDIRAVMRAVTDQDHEPLERWRDLRDGEIAVIWDASLGGTPVCLAGIEAHALPRRGFVPGDGPVQWTSGTLFPRASNKLARAINAASGNRPLVVLANLAGFDGSPESMRALQLEYGAEIGRAVVNFDGPIVFCVVSRYHGGAFVVFSKRLNDELEAIALDGARASVIGGAPAAAVVFARDVDARTAEDPRIARLERALAGAPAADKAALRDQLATQRPVVRSAKLGEIADEYDQIHSVERAQQVGSLDRIVPVRALRPALIDALERGMTRTLARWTAARAPEAPA
jgi:acetyl/propionyl-CoA carboxylase alpha subunit/acetyl-CoA carboxylase carboxyltransferase component